MPVPSVLDMQIKPLSAPQANATDLSQDLQQSELCQLQASSPLTCGPHNSTVGEMDVVQKQDKGTLCNMEFRRCGPSSACTPACVQSTPFSSTYYMLWFKLLS